MLVVIRIVAGSMSRGDLGLGKVSSIDGGQAACRKQRLRVTYGLMERGEHEVAAGRGEQRGRNNLLGDT